jgi:hypothetical protein
VGEGETFVGSTRVTIDAAGFANFSVKIPSKIAFKEWITTTATHDSLSNTSEFSASLFGFGLQP